MPANGLLVSFHERNVCRSRIHVWLPAADDNQRNGAAQERLNASRTAHFVADDSVNPIGAGIFQGLRHGCVSWQQETDVPVVSCSDELRNSDEILAARRVREAQDEQRAPYFSMHNGLHYIKMSVLNVLKSDMEVFPNRTWLFLTFVLRIWYYPIRQASLLLQTVNSVNEIIP